MLTDKEGNAGQLYVKLKGLDPVAWYEVEGKEGRYSGALFMNAGIPVPASLGEYESIQFVLRTVQEKK